jgi:nicotinamidase/pyrazinamidase
MQIDEHSALIVVDIQPDFLPGGALGVEHGDEILEPVAQLLGSGRFRHVIATQDWHPPGHVSFASSHPSRQPFEAITLYGREQVLWPDHCVQGTPGAALHSALPWQSVDAIIRKGVDPDVDSYSTFRNNWNRSGARPPTGLAGYLRERGVESVFICGLARDYCVSWSAEDALTAGFATAVLWDLTRSVDPSSDTELESRLRSLGVTVAESTNLGS